LRGVDCGVSDIWIILSAIGFIGTLIISLIRFYAWHKDRKGEDLEEIYKPLHSEIRRIMEQIETLSLPRKHVYANQKYIPLETWQKIRESRSITRIPRRMRKRLKDFYERRVPEYVNILLTVEKAIRYQIHDVTQLKLGRTMIEAIKAEKRWNWDDRRSFWNLEPALADILTPYIIQGREILSISLDSLDESLGKELKENIREDESIEKFLQLLNSQLEKDPGLKILQKVKDDITIYGDNLTKDLQKKIKKLS